MQERGDGRDEAVEAEVSNEGGIHNAVDGGVRG